MACPVCFGGDDIFVRESLNAGIGVLLGVTAVVLGLFLRFFLRLARRAREHAHLVEPLTEQSARRLPDERSVRLQPDGRSVRLQPDQGNL
jgi:hypothetical protein